MRRNVDLAEISDGRLYKEQDMVKADCHGCAGCHKCCTGMGQSIVLDPYDVWRFQVGMGTGLETLMADQKVELNVVDGCILPNLKMMGSDEACGFLREDGRCSIHAHRPGICRLFPLGRIYENGDFSYFLQTGECELPGRSKVKVEKWLDTPQVARYHQFLCDWHYLLNAVEQRMVDEKMQKSINMRLLQIFYFTPYEMENFYGQIELRMENFRQEIGVI